MDASSPWASNQRRNLFISALPSRVSTWHFSCRLRPTPLSALVVLSVGCSLQWPGRLLKLLCLSPSWKSGLTDLGVFNIRSLKNLSWWLQYAAGAAGVQSHRDQDHPTCSLPWGTFLSCSGHTLSSLGPMFGFICVSGTHTGLLLFLLTAALQLTHLQICPIATVSL